MRKSHLIIIISLLFFNIGLGTIYLLVPEKRPLLTSDINTNKQLINKADETINCGLSVATVETPSFMTKAYKCFEEYGEKCQPAKYIESSGDGYHSYEVTIKGTVKDEQWQKKLCEEWKKSDYCSTVNPYPSNRHNEICLIEFKVLEYVDPLMVGKKANCYIPNNPIAINKESALMLYDPNRCEGDLIEYQLNNNPNFSFQKNNFLKAANVEVNINNNNKQLSQNNDNVFNCGIVNDRLDMTMHETPNYKCFEYYAEKCLPTKATMKNEWFNLEQEIKGVIKDKAKFDEICSFGDMPTFCYTLNTGSKDELCVVENMLLESKELSRLEGMSSICYVPNNPLILRDEDFMFNFYGLGCEGQLSSEYIKEMENIY